MKVPAEVGVPEIVIVLDAQAAVTPAGRPEAVPMPMALVVICVIAVRAVLMHRVGVEEAAPTVLSGVTVMVPEAFTVPHPPVSSMV